MSLEYTPTPSAQKSTPLIQRVSFRNISEDILFCLTLFKIYRFTFWWRQKLCVLNLSREIATVWCE